MNEPNGPVTERILSLEAARASRPLKKNDFITVKHAREMVAEECAKVHEYYLTQIPDFAARMIQDALLHYGLIKPIEPVDIPTADPAPDVPPAMDPVA